jgi:26S proteasome regulatory subunit N1
MGERAELATDEFIPETTVLENFAILRPNPNYEPDFDHIKDKKK